MQQQRTLNQMGILIVFILLLFCIWMVLVAVVVMQRPSLAANQVIVDDEIITLAINRDDVAEIVGDPVAVQEAPVEPVPEPVEVQVEAAPAEPLPTATPEGFGSGGMATEKYIFSKHVVQPTDTLYSLAAAFNTTIPLLARFGTSTLIPGTEVVITQANPAYCAPAVSYIVHQGDTPGSIAAMYGITVEELAAMNGAQGTLAVYETDVICVP